MLTRFFYNLLLILVAPLLLLGLYKRKPNKPLFGSRWKEHFGQTPALPKQTMQPLWIHAVSVGESIAATPLIKALKARNSQQIIIVTTTTSTGAEQIAKLGDLVEHRYMPIDFSFAIKRFLKVINPSQLLIIETELWPNTLRCVHQLNIPVSIINARLSEKSARNYQKLQPLFDQIHPCLTQVLCQTDDDAQRFLSLGVASEKLTVTGSIKFDLDISATVIKQGQELRQQLGIQRSIWIAASTHQGEDEQILKAHQELIKNTSNNTNEKPLLILVPRHPERFQSVFELCLQQGFTTAKRTANTSVNNDTSVYLADTMGEMLLLIAAADICFMGGSLIGDKVGGHNVLEPAALAKPIITGPSDFNFKQIVTQLIDAKALVKITDAKSLAMQLSEWFKDSQQILQYGQNAQQSIQQSQGALAHTVDLITEHQ